MYHREVSCSFFMFLKKLSLFLLVLAGFQSISTDASSLLGDIGAVWSSSDLSMNVVVASVLPLSTLPVVEGSLFSTDTISLA